MVITTICFDFFATFFRPETTWQIDFHASLQIFHMSMENIVYTTLQFFNLTMNLII